MDDNNKRFDEFYLEVNKYARGIHILKDGIESRNIKVFENKYRVELPSNYKEWLMMNNGAALFAIPAGTNISGILGYDIREKELFYLEDNFHDDKRRGIPDNMFIIAENCCDRIIGFDRNRTDLIDGVIISWNYRYNRVEEEWSCFEEWLNYEIKNGQAVRR